MIAALFQCAALGAQAPRARRTAYMIAPATKNLLPTMRFGGNVSIANRIARYVEPQMM